jgi:hypothetical protein
LHSADVADLGALIERSGRSLGDLHPLGVRWAEAEADVEIVDGRERAVDGRGLAFRHGL